MTAVAVTHGDRVVYDVVQVGVTFRFLADAEIADYIATGEPMVLFIRTPERNSTRSVSIFCRPPRP